MFASGTAVKHSVLIALVMLVGFGSPMQGVLSDIPPSRIAGPFTEKNERGANARWATIPHELTSYSIAEHRIQCWPLSTDLKSMTPIANPYAEPEDECRYPAVTANASTVFIL